MGPDMPFSSVTAVISRCNLHATRFKMRFTRRGNRRRQFADRHHARAARLDGLLAEVSYQLGLNGRGLDPMVDVQDSVSAAAYV